MHLLLGKVNPILYFYRLPFAKRHFQKMNVDPIIEINKSYKNPKSGISIFFSGNLMNALLFFIFIGIDCIYNGVKKEFFIDSIFIIIVIGLISLGVNYFLLFKKDKYLKYFEEFDKMEDHKKKEWAILSLLVFLGIMLFSIGSFVFMISRLNN